MFCVVDEDNEQEEDSNSSEIDLDPAQHKESLMKLKDTDPEFYNYLMENDRGLLDFKASDDEEEVDDDSLKDDSDNKHIPNKNLEVYIYKGVYNNLEYLSL